MNKAKQQVHTAVIFCDFWLMSVSEVQVMWPVSLWFMWCHLSLCGSGAAGQSSRWRKCECGLGWCHPAGWLRKKLLLPAGSPLRLRSRPPESDRQDMLPVEHTCYWLSTYCPPGLVAALTDVTIYVPGPLVRPDEMSQLGSDAQGSVGCWWHSLSAPPDPH